MTSVSRALACASSQTSAYRIVGPGWLAAPAAHEPLKGNKVRPPAMLGKELGRIHRRQFLGGSGRDELVDTDTVLLCPPLYFRFDRARQTEWIGTLIFHVPILRIASAGVSTSMPKGAGAAPTPLERHKRRSLPIDRCFKHTFVGWIV